MERDLILGTAGHIDHGKTALIRALTGIDCDRLPEEKSRGITIDIGFAHLRIGEQQFGIVDVPGHERFIRNMLAGATGIDLALLVVAADDSVMPQTREHLEILKLLGLQHGVIAITKCDLVDDTTRDVIALEVRELVAGSFLENAPILFTSASKGTGLEELKAALAEAAKAESRERPTRFRLAIDRAFVVQGHGTVITGSVASGSVQVGETLDWHRGDGQIESVRVRGLNQHGQSVGSVHRGQRAGINLAGVPHEEVHRGQELCSPGYLKPSRILSVRLTPTSRTLKHRLPVRLHIGTAEIQATLSLLDRDRAEVGDHCLAQLSLKSPAVAVWGQPFVLRDSSAEHTLGGGIVLQPVATRLRRRDAEALERLSRLASSDAATRANEAVWFAGFEEVQSLNLARDAGYEGEWTAHIHPDRLAELDARVLETLASLHREFPLLTLIPRVKLTNRLEYLGDLGLISSTIERLLTSGRMVGDPHHFARADFKPKLNTNQRKMKDRIVAAHAGAGCQPPEPKTFAFNGVKDIFEVAVAEGLLVKVTDELYLHAEVEAAMIAKVRQRLEAGRTATVAEIRDVLGTTRKYAVPLCEYLDRRGITVRSGDVRSLSAETR